MPQLSLPLLRVSTIGNRNSSFNFFLFFFPTGGGFGLNLELKHDRRKGCTGFWWQVYNCNSWGNSLHKYVKMNPYGFFLGGKKWLGNSKRGPQFQWGFVWKHDATTAIQSLMQRRSQSLLRMPFFNPLILLYLLASSNMCLVFTRLTPLKLENFIITPVKQTARRRGCAKWTRRTLSENWLLASRRSLTAQTQTAGCPWRK